MRRECCYYAVTPPLSLQQGLLAPELLCTENMHSLICMCSAAQGRSIAAGSDPVVWHVFGTSATFLAASMPTCMIHLPADRENTTTDAMLQLLSVILFFVGATHLVRPEDFPGMSYQRTLPLINKTIVLALYTARVLFISSVSLSCCDLKGKILVQ